MKCSEGMDVGENPFVGSLMLRGSDTNGKKEKNSPRKISFRFFYGYWFSLSKLLKEWNEREFLLQLPAKRITKSLQKGVETKFEWITKV